MTSVGSILSGAFRVVTGHPVSVAIWAVVFTLFTLATNGATMNGPLVNPEAFRSGAISPLNIIGAAFLIMLLSLAFSSVMMCAVYRTVLRPAERGFAGLRIGMDELRMLGLFLILIVAGIFLGLILALVFGLLAGGIMAASGGSSAMFIVIGVLYIVLVCAMIYFMVRLSLIFPMTFVRRRIAIDDGWALSRGHFWTLFLAYLVIFVVGVVLYCVLVMPFAPPIFADMIRNFSNPQAMQSAQAEEMAALAARPFATLALLSVLSGIMQAITQALNGGASATAVRELLRDRGEVLDDDIEETARVFE